MTETTRRQWLAAAGATFMSGSLQARSNVNDEIRGLAHHAPLGMQYRGASASECRAWQEKFAATLRTLLGPHRPPQRWETIREEVVDLEDHRRQALVLRAEGHPDLPLYLLTPKPEASAARPGIVALHGHGPFGNDSVAGIAGTPDRKSDIEKANYDYGLQLVRRGYVVVAPCLTPFGRRLDNRKAYGGDDPCAVTFVRMQLLGKILMAENLRDALWSFEFLTHQRGVDAARIGCVGLSYGGRMTMLTAALEPRIRVAVISGALNVMQERILGRYSCGAQVIPGLLQHGDVPEIASLIAPRPCLWEVGRQDALMVKDRIEPALERIRRAYRAFDALDLLALDSFDGAHRWNGVQAYPLLAGILRPEA